MARTYSYGELLRMIGPEIPRNQSDEQAALILNKATNFIWKRYDWREYITSLPPFYLIPNEQDHGAPAVSIPSDFTGLRSAYLVRLQATPPERTPLAVKNFLDLTHARYLPHAIAYRPDAAAFRVLPRVPENIGSPDWLIEGIYKKRPTKVVPGSLFNVTLPIDDAYIEVWTEVIKHVANPKDPGQAQLAYMSVDEMASNEGLELGEPTVAPSEPLIATVPRFSPVLGWGQW
jgi:hypothetical protein